MKKGLHLIQTIPASLVGKGLKTKLGITMKTVLKHTRESQILNKESQDLSLPYIVQGLKNKDQNERNDVIQEQMIKNFQLQRA